MTRLTATLLLALLPIASTDAQVQTIDFLGQPITAEEFYFCWDESGSQQGEWDSVKAEVSAALTQLAPTSRFGLIRFGSWSEQYSATPVLATSANVLAAIAWLDGPALHGTTCIGSGIEAAISVANLGVGARRVLVISDGHANCPGCASEIPQATNANWQQQIPIDAFRVGPPDPFGAQCLMDLTFANGGNYYDVGTLRSDFVRGDADGSGAVALPDAIAILQYAFGLGAVSCVAAADVNADHDIDIGDAIQLVLFLFAMGMQPPAPFASCGAGNWWEPCVDFASCP